MTNVDLPTQLGDAAGSVGAATPTAPVPDSPGATHDAVFQLLRDLVPHVPRALLVGCSDVRVIEHVASWVSHVDVLGGPTAEVQSRNVQWLADTAALSLPGVAPYDVVLALDGLEDGSAVSDAATWRDRLELYASFVTPGGTFAVAVAGPHTVEAALGFPPPDRSGTVAPEKDDTLPASDLQLLDAMAAVGHPVATVHCLFGADTPTLVLADDVARAARPGHLPTQLVAGVSRPELRPAVKGMARAGMLPALASGWVAVSGGRGRPVYFRDPRGRWLAARLSPTGTRWLFDTIGIDEASGRVTVGAGPNLETELLGAAAAGDLTRFRHLAQAYGNYVRRTGDESDFADLYIDGATFTSPAGGRPVDGDVEGATVAAHDVETIASDSWARFCAQLGDFVPVWDQGKSVRALLAEWLAFSGVTSETAAQTAEAALARHVKNSPASEVGVAPGSSGVASVADTTSPALESRLAEVDALREAVALRDTRLEHREAYIRRLRHDWMETQRALEEAISDAAKVTSSRAYRTGSRIETVRQPRKLASVVGAKAARLVRRAAVIARR